MKTPTDLAAARRRRATGELEDAIAVTRKDLHASIDRLFDALETFVAAAEPHAPAAVRRNVIVNLAEAAEHLGISQPALRNLVAQQLVPCIRLPSTRGSRPIMRFDLNDLDQYLQSRKQSA